MTNKDARENMRKVVVRIDGHSLVYGWFLQILETDRETSLIYEDFDGMICYAMGATVQFVDEFPGELSQREDDGA